MKNPLSTEALIEWLERQPKDEEYPYFDDCGCLLHQYLTSVGFEDVSVGGTFWFTGGVEHALPPAWSQIAVWHPRTYGGALQRAAAVR